MCRRTARCTLVDRILADTSTRFGERYSRTGRPSIPPEQLLRGCSCRCSSRSAASASSSDNPTTPARRADPLQPVVPLVRRLGHGRCGVGPHCLQHQSRPSAQYQRRTPEHDHPTGAAIQEGRVRGSEAAPLMHALSENRNGLVVDVGSTPATGRAEWKAVIRMIDRSVRKPGAPRRNVRRGRATAH